MSTPNKDYNSWLDNFYRNPYSQEFLYTSSIISNRNYKDSIVYRRSQNESSSVITSLMPQSPQRKSSQLNIRDQIISRQITCLSCSENVKKYLEAEKIAKQKKQQLDRDREKLEYIQQQNSYLRDTVQQMKKELSEEKEKNRINQKNIQILKKKVYDIETNIEQLEKLNQEHQERGQTFLNQNIFINESNLSKYEQNSTSEINNSDILKDKFDSLKQYYSEKIQKTIIDQYLKIQATQAIVREMQLKYQLLIYKLQPNQNCLFSKLKKTTTLPFN